MGFGNDGRRRKSNRFQNSRSDHSAGEVDMDPGVWMDPDPATHLHSAGRIQGMRVVLVSATCVAEGEGERWLVRAMKCGSGNISEPAFRGRPPRSPPYWDTRRSMASTHDHGASITARRKSVGSPEITPGLWKVRYSQPVSRAGRPVSMVVLSPPSTSLTARFQVVSWSLPWMW